MSGPPVSPAAPAALGPRPRWPVQLLRPHWPALVVVSILTIAGSAVSLAYPLFAQFLVDRVLLGGESGLLPRIAFWLVVAGLLNHGVALTTKLLHARITVNVLYDLRRRILLSLHAQPLRALAKLHRGDLLARVGGDAAEVQAVITDGVLRIFSTAAVLVGGTALLFSLNARLAGLVLLVAPFGAFALTRARERVTKAARDLRERNGALGGVLVESVDAVRTVRALGAESAEERRFLVHAEPFCKEVVRFEVLSGVVAIIPQAALMVAAVLVLVIGGGDVIAKRMSLGELVAFSAMLTRVLLPLQGLAGLYVWVQRGRAALDRLAALGAFAAPPTPGGSEAPRFEGEWRLEDACFELGPLPGPPPLRGGGRILDRVSFAVRPGETLALVGRSGAGKTTALDLLLGLAKPTSGKATHSGSDLEVLDNAELRRAIGAVLDPPFVFDASVIENVAYPGPPPSPSDPAVLRALTIAGIAERAEAGGLETPVGDRGAKLSHGERARVAIARAILRQPKLLALDEATAALEPQLEEQVLSAIRAALPGIAIVVVTQRSSAARLADRVVLLDGGKVSATGSHDELLETSALYAEILKERPTAPVGQGPRPQAVR